VREFARMKGKEIVDKSGHYKNITGAAAQLHGWDTRFEKGAFSR